MERPGEGHCHGVEGKVKTKHLQWFHVLLALIAVYCAFRLVVLSAGATNADYAYFFLATLAEVAMSLYLNLRKERPEKVGEVVSAIAPPPPNHR